MNTINKEGIIYTRVSSNKQVTDGHGLDGQYSACLRYAEENNIKVIKTIIDPGYSGKSIQSGKFGANMKVTLINDGPVTIIIDSKNKQ